MDLYDDLPLPWDEGDPGFDEVTLVRREWNKGGKVEKGKTFWARSQDGV
jgi:hypothetical protein